MRYILLVVGSATMTVLFLMLAGMMFVTWGVDFSSLTAGDRGGLLCIFALLEIVALGFFSVLLEDYR